MFLCAPSCRCSCVPHRVPQLVLSVFVVYKDLLVPHPHPHRVPQLVAHLHLHLVQAIETRIRTQIKAIEAQVAASHLKARAKVSICLHVCVCLYPYTC